MMKRAKMLLILFSIFGFLWTNHSVPCHAQNPAKTLTILYSNNINGEIEPCPG